MQAKHRIFRLRCQSGRSKDPPEFRAEYEPELQRRTSAAYDLDRRASAQPEPERRTSGHGFSRAVTDSTPAASAAEGITKDTNDQSEWNKNRLDVLEAERAILTIELRNAVIRAAQQLLPEAIRLASRPL